MEQPRLRQDGLVLYKGKLARVLRLAKKIEIELEGGETLSVRPKDVTPLHPGPVESLQDVQPQAGEVETAWELLAGRTTTLAELAELAYGDYTPATAWAACQSSAWSSMRSRPSSARMASGVSQRMRRPWYMRPTREQRSASSM